MEQPQTRVTNALLRCTRKQLIAFRGLYAGAVTLGFLSLCSCSNEAPISVAKQPYGPLAEPIVSDAKKLPPQPSLQDIAFSFPVFEIGADATKQAIRRGDIKPIETPNHLTIEGDGAQPTVQIDRLSPPKTDPIRVRLTLGPVFDGIGAHSPVYSYDFERVIGGWKRLHYTFSDPAGLDHAR